MTAIEINLERLARTALLAFLQVSNENNKRTKAWAVADARFQGICTAAAALGVVQTPFALEMAVLTAIREAQPRPEHFHRTQTAWDQEVTDKIAASLQPGGRDWPKWMTETSSPPIF